MRLVEIDEPLEITTIGDVPAGTGMGSSSSLTAACSTPCSPTGARSSAAAAGGEGLPDRDRHPQEADRPPGPVRRGLWRTELHPLQPRQHRGRRAGPCRAETLAELEQRTLLFYTGQTRDANEILEQQSKGPADRMEVLRQMRDLADEMRPSRWPVTATSTISRRCCTPAGS